MLKDAVEDSWIYQEWMQEAQEKGMEKGMEKGRQEMLEGLRQTVVEVVQERFPQLLDVARQHVGVMHDAVQLRHLIVKMSTVQTVETAQQYLLDQ